MNRRRSKAILVSLDLRIDSAQKASHLLHSPEGDQLHAAIVYQDLKPLSGPDTERLTNLARKYDVKLRAHLDCFHASTPSSFYLTTPSSGLEAAA